ncbi:1651_t:CDS:2, partial [Funneliformis caledonium]
EDLTSDFTGSIRLDDSYSDCLNEHHIRESVDLNDKKVGGGCYDSTGDNIAFVAKSRANLLIRRSTNPKDENDENIYYDSIGNNVVSVNCDVTSLTRVSGSHDTF